MSIEPVACSAAALAATKNRFAEVYRGNRNVLVTCEWNSPGDYGQLEQLDDQELDFQAAILDYNRNTEALAEGFDNIPVISFCSAVAYMMALAYGCRMVKSNGFISALPLILSAGSMDTLQPLQHVHEHGLYPMVLERITLFQERYGNLPITISDNQSPIDAATSIVNSEVLMLAMFDDPPAVHRVLSMITDSIIEINRTYQSLIQESGGFRAGHFLPFGMHVSDDDAAFLSPDIYKEFALPYIDRLSEEFGGMAFHCCMGHAQNLINFSRAKGFMGFDAMFDFNPTETVLEAISGKGVWNVYNFGFARRKDSPLSDLQLFETVLARTEGRCGLLLNVYAPEKERALELAWKVKNQAHAMGRV